MVDVYGQKIADFCDCLMDLQDVVTTLEIVVANQKIIYSKGELFIKALVKRHKSEYYYDVFQSVHKHNSIGEIVALSVPNLGELIPKYQKRYSTPKSQW